MATLAAQTPGSLVKISENGALVNFLVLCHDYPAQGRTLLLRNDLYDTRTWGSNNAYESSEIDTWLGGTYLDLLDPLVSAQISQVEIACTRGNGNTTVSTLSRRVFLLSYTEMGFSAKYAKIEGTAIPYFDSNEKRIAYLDGTATLWWLRSPHTNTKTNAWRIANNGTGALSNNVTTSCGSRPAFTLPSDIGVAEDGRITTNQPPSVPSLISVPQSAMTGSEIVVSWTASSDPEGEAITYTLERKINGGDYTPIYTGGQTSYSDTVSYPCTVQYRVKAADESGAESGYTESSTLAVTMNYSNLIIGGDI